MTGVASAALAGAWLATRRLWLPIGMHFACNYLFDAFLSVPVSGHPARGWVQVQQNSRAAGCERRRGHASGGTRGLGSPPYVCRYIYRVKPSSAVTTSSIPAS